jgi:branched-chain amino acid transport system substrate-binding protein
MRRIANLMMVATVALAGCSSVTEPPGNTKVIVIAGDFPLQGQYSRTGLSMADGVRFAVEQQRTIGQFQVVFKSFDDTLAGEMDPVKGLANVRRMAADSQTLGMVGPYASQIAQAEIPEASQYGPNLAMVSPSTTANCLTVNLPGCRPPARPGGINNFFRIAAPDIDQTTAMADFAVKVLGVTKIAVLSDGDGYGEGLANGFAQELPAAGGTVILRQQLQQSTNDYSELLRRIKDLGGQAIYAGGGPSSGVCRFRAQMPAVLPQVYFLGGDALLDPSCISDAKNAADGMIATIAQGRPSTDAQTTRVLDGYKRTGWPVTPYTYASYDCAEILMDAIQRAMDANGGRVPSRSQVVEALTMTHFQGITGRWSFDGYGDVTAPAISFYRVERGSWTFWQAVNVGHRSV